MDTAGRQDAIRVRLARYAELYAEGDVDRERFDQEKARAAADMDTIEAESALIQLPQSVEWDVPAATTNGVLRAMWRYVQLGDDMQPVRAEWVKPEWRRA